MILGIDTSLGTAVAVVEPDGVVLAEASSPNPLGHAEVIGELLQTVLSHARSDAPLGHPGAMTPGAPATVTAVAAGMGPGPFTGLRVGIAAARAFALGRDIPLVPVVSHDAVALGILLNAAMTDADPGLFAVVTDARRREFAYTLYDGLDEDGLPVRVAEPALAPRDGLDALLVARGAARQDVGAVPAPLVALVAARTLAGGREVTIPEALYLRSPDVTMPTGPKRVGV